MSAAPQVPLARRLERFLIVRLAGKEFALESRRILGMMQMRGLPLVKLEGRSGWDALVELHGRRLPVYTPNRGAGVATRPVTARSCLVLLAGEQARHEPGFCLRVDSISRFEVMRPASIREVPGTGRMVRLSEKWRPVIDLDPIASEAARYAWTIGRRATTI